MSSADLPSWLPPGAQDVQEELAQATLRKIQRCPVHVPLMQRSLQTAYLATAPAAAGSGTCSFTAAKSLMAQRLTLHGSLHTGMSSWHHGVVSTSFRCQLNFQHLCVTLQYLIQRCPKSLVDTLQPRFL